MSSLNDLNKQIEFWSLDKESKAQPATEFLKKYMIRHTKSQRINGEVALCLRESTKTVKMVTMTIRRERQMRRLPVESRTFFGEDRIVVCLREWPKEMVFTNHQTHYLCRFFQTRAAQEGFESALRSGTKHESSGIFAIHINFAREAVKSMSVKTYCFDESMTADQRDK